MYKLVAIDLDGTLLNSNGEISKRNKDAILKAVEKGVIVVLASGRMPSSVKNLAKEIGANKYIISGNGTIIYDLQNDEIIYDAFIEKDKALEIIKTCEENSIYYNVYTKDSVLTKSLNYNVLFYDNENSHKPIEKRTNINIIEDIYNYVKQNNIDILKITICDSDKSIFSSIVKKIKTIQKINILDVEHMSRKNIKAGSSDIAIEYYYTEIAKSNTNKWNAIEFLIRKLGIKKEEVMAIGDNVNDKEMVENAGLGVSMGDSLLAVNNIGNIVVSNNNSDGVAEAIENYVNSQ